MAPSDSFDPRTWHGDDPAPTKGAAPATEPFSAPPRPAASHKWWLGPLLSGAVFAGGAALAYETRLERPVTGLQSAAD